MEKCSYCGSIDDRGMGLCGECFAGHFAGECEGRVGSCEACLIVSVAALMGGE